MDVLEALTWTLQQKLKTSVKNTLQVGGAPHSSFLGTANVEKLSCAGRKPNSAYLLEITLPRFTATMYWP